MKSKLGKVFNAITFLCISLICVIGLGFGLRASGVTGENFVTKLLAFEGTTSDSDYVKGPERSKTLIPHDDGSYELSLKVLGESEERVTKANVIIVLDSSGSMRYLTESDTGMYGSSKQYIPSTDDYYYNSNTHEESKRVDLYDASHNRITTNDYAGKVYTMSGNGRNATYSEYTGQRYSSVDRMAAAKAAINELAAELLGKNDFTDSSTANDDIIEMALISFSTNASNSTIPTNKISTFQGYVNNVSADGGTNWDQALQKVASVNFGADDNDPTYVIFVSDGNPTYYMKGNDTKGDGTETAENINVSYNAAKESAKNIVSKLQYTFYAIGAYGNVSRMVDLVEYSGASADNYFDASNTEDVNDAFASISSDISKAGYGEVKIIDGTTSNVTTSTNVVAHLLTVDINSFKYYKNNVEWPKGEAPEASLNDNGEVVWDLGSGVLEDGVTYEVRFDVWPSQYTLDLIADLKNGKVDYSSLPKAITDYLVKTETGEYVLATNTVATIEYNDTRTTDGKQTGKFTNPDPVATESYTLNIEKIWANGLDPNRYSAEPVELGIYRDGEVVEDLLINSLINWKNSTEIAVGIMKRDLTTNAIKIYEVGHEYSFVEPTDLSYHWELDAQVVRPMLINNTLKLLIKDNKTTMSSDYEIITKDGVNREYFKIDGKVYYIDESVTKLIATNNRRSYFEFNKVVTGDDIPEDAKFEYTVKVDNSYANLEDNLESDDDEIWFSIYKGNDLIHDVETSAQAEKKNDVNTGYYYVNSGTEFTVELEAGWNLRIINLPTGSTYTVSETSMPNGFEVEKVEGPGTISGNSVSGTITDWNKAYSVTYINKYLLQDVIVNKIWEDNSNQDGIRPSSLDLVLKADGDVVGTTPVVTKNGNTWIYTYKALPKDKTYTVAETTVPQGYEATVDGLTVTNYHKTYVRDITVSKVWNDDDNRDGVRPDMVKVQLKADGASYGEEVVLDAANGWEYTFEGLNTNKAGKAINYTVEELPVEGYETTVDGFVVTNTHSPNKTKLSVHKVWDDADNQDGERPNSVTVKLMIDNSQAKDINGNYVVLTLSEDNDWTTETPSIYVKDNGIDINYTWVEEDVGHDYVLTGNEKSKDVNTLTIITNKRTLEETEATVKKVWNDDNNRDRLQPPSIAVKLLANGVAIKDEKGEDKVFTLSSSNNWEHKETGLSYKKNGQVIEYTWEEVGVVEGYEATVQKNGTITTITNTHTPETTTATFTKVWNDKGNQDRVRPDSIELELYAGTKKVSNAPDPTIVENGDNTWTITYSGLPKNDAGEEITYTIKEINVNSNYTASVSEDGKTITNTHKVDTIDISASKTWVDDGNRDGKRPSGITLELINKDTGAVVRTEEMKPDKDGNWNYTFKNVDRNKDGKEVTYELKEVSVPNYSTDPIVGNQKTGFTIKNSYTPETITYTGAKVWNDDNNRDGVRPPSVTVVLRDEEGSIVARALVNNESNWAYSLTVPKNEAGKPINYVLEELPVEGYEAAITSVTSEDGKVINSTVTNTHEVEKNTLTGVKNWVDDNNRDGLRPDSVTIKLLANGKQAKDINNRDMIANVTGPEWKYSFVDVPVNEAGEEIKYTVVEELDDEKHITGNVKTGYEASYNGLNVTNTHESATKSITTRKIWNDKADNDDIRPDSITVKLWALEAGENTLKDSMTVKAKDNWSAVFSNLPVYKDGNEIVYSITEDEIDGYTASITEGSYTITNTHELQTTTFTVNKEWIDDNNRDGVRPSSVIVTLLADGNIVKDQDGNNVTATLSSENDWSYTFEGLQKKNNKKPIVYTVVEQDTGDSGYSTTYRTCSNEEVSEDKCIEGAYIVTNTYDPLKTTVTVVKSWDDDSNRDGVRPTSVKVQLKADGASYGEAVVLDAANGWKYTFENLNKFRDGGKEIVYSVEEVDVNDEYTSSVSKTTCEEDEENCIPGIYVITNKHDIETVQVLGEVFWDDQDNQDGVRPEDVTICVHANGELVECTTVNLDDDSWKYEFEDLPKNQDGEEIIYTVTEDDIEYYDINLDGYNFTNKHVPDEGEVLGESEEFCEGCEVAGENKENDSSNPETGDTILPYALLLLTSLGGMSFTAKKIVDRQK